MLSSFLQFHTVKDVRESITIEKDMFVHKKSYVEEIILYLFAGKNKIDGKRFMLYSHGKSLLSPSILTKIIWSMLDK